MSEAAAEKKAAAPLIVGRYALFDELAAGGMATVHLARLLMNEGPGRTVAVKRLHVQYTKDAEFCAMFTDEARLVTRIKHPNCVRTVDVVQNDEGLFLVMEYVHGESLSRLMRSARERKEPISPKLIATLIHNALLGLHAAHEVTGDDGKLLGVVHRDVSPQNIIVGVDGAAKVLDFGIAKAAGRMQTTREGQIKGKLAYMAPEQIRGQVDRRTDVFAAAVCLWEALAARRLHEGLKDVEIVTRVVQGKFVPPSSHASGIPPELDQIVLKGLAADPKKRYLTAKDMAADIESKVGLVDRSEVTRWVEKLAKPTLDRRAAKVAAMEKASKDLRPSSPSLRMPSLSTPDAFLPVLTVAAARGSRPEEDVQAELDSVAPTTPPPYTPSPEIIAAARGGKPPVAAKAAPKARGKSSDKPAPPSPGSSQALRVATPVLPMSPFHLTAGALPSVATPGQITAPVGAPVPNVPTTPPGPNDTGHTQLTPSGTEVPFFADAQNPETQPQNRGPLIYLLLAASMLLALTGAGLGGYAIAKRGQPITDPAPTVTPTNPNVTTPPVPSPTTEPPPPPRATAKTRPPKPSIVAPPSATTSAMPSSADPDEPGPSGSASVAPTTNAPPTATALPAKKPVAKPAGALCDPPFVVDENGNKKFKPECMGL